MKILCKQTQFWGQQLNLPEVGATQIDAEGFAEVPETVGALLCDGLNWQDPALEVALSEAEELEAAPEDKELTAKLTGALDDMTLAQLCELAEQTGVKGWQRFAKKEAALRSLIKNQMAKQGQ